LALPPGRSFLVENFIFCIRKNLICSVSTAALHPDPPPSRPHPPRVLAGTLTVTACRAHRRRSRCCAPDGDPRLQVSHSHRRYIWPLILFGSSSRPVSLPSVLTRIYLSADLVPVPGVTSARAVRRSMTPTWLRCLRPPPRLRGGPPATTRGSGAR
jgi:hypothetical protein